MRKKLEQTFREERASLMSFIRRRVNRMEDAEDILQETFVSTLTSLDVTEPINNLVGWLYRTARNKIIDGYRRKGRSPEVETIDELLADISGDVESEYLRRQWGEAIIGTIDRLPPAQREIFIQTELEGRSFREISEATGTSINTLLSRKRYGVRTLRRELTELKRTMEQN